MLAPDLNLASSCLAEAYKNILSADNVAMIGQSLFVGELVQKPKWIDTLKLRLENIKDASNEWTKYRSDILANSLSAFINYAASFETISDIHNELSSDILISLLNELKICAQNSRNNIKLESDKFSNWLNNVGLCINLIQESINSAWDEMSDEEEQMLTLVKKIAEFHTELNEIEGNIDEDTLLKGGNIIKSIVSISYGIITTTGSIPYLSFAGVFLSIGKMFYDIFKTQENISNLLNEISNEKLTLSLEAQALAQTKAMIKFLYDIHEKVIVIDNGLNGLVSLWDTEIDKINNLINLLESKVSPKDILDIASMNAALETWKTIKSISQSIILEPKTGISFKIVLGSN